jgi:D-3-phosphoglycerate dehydrogenase
MEAAVKVVILDGYGDDAIERDVLVSAGAEVVTTGLAPGEPFPEPHSDAAVIMSVAYPIRRPLIESLPGLRMIARYGVGLDSVDLVAAGARGVTVTNVPDANYPEVAAHALALALACLRKIFPAAAGLPFGDHRPVAPIHRLAAVTLGIVGLGRSGRALAALARGLFGRTMYYDPFVDSPADMPHVERSTDLDTLLAEADCVSLHTPLTPDTRLLLNGGRLARMKRGASIVNTSRGALIDEQALADALRSGHLAAAGLDVLATEPARPDEPLLAVPQVIYTPHLAWYSVESLRDSRTTAAEEVRRFLAREPLRHRVL